MAKIFQSLTQAQRLVVKLVCYQWLEIIQNEPCFRGDRHLHFDYCVLNNECPPASIFLKSVTAYESLKIDHVRIAGSLQGLFKKIGQNLKELNLSQMETTQQVKDVLGNGKNFPKLRVLHLNFRLWKANLEITIKSVTVLYLDNFYNTTEIFESILEAFPALEKIYIQSIDYFEGLNFNNIKREAAKIKDLGQNFFQYGIEGSIWKTQWEGAEQKDELETNLFDIIVQEELKLERLDYRVREIDGFGDLSFILAVQQSLKEVKLSCNVFPPLFFSQITELNIGLMIDITSLEPLSALVNLKKLEISLSDMYEDNETSPCFFSHNILAGGNQLKSLEITTGGDKNCLECWKKLFLSYKQLEKFSLSIYGDDNVVIGLIFMYLLSLKELHLARQVGNLHRKAKSRHGKGMPHLDFQQKQDFLSSWKQMARLEKVTLSRVTKITQKGIDNFCKMCPNLIYLKLNDSQVTEPDEIFEIIAKELKYLEVLKVDLETHTVTSKLADSIANYCHRLKILELGRNEMRQISNFRKKQLFIVISTLKLIRSIYWDPKPITRTQFYESILNLN